MQLDSNQTSTVGPFSGKTVNMLRQLAIITEELHRGFLTEIF